MLIEQLIRETLELQGFRIESVIEASPELVVKIAPVLRYPPRCRKCGIPATIGIRSLKRNEENILSYFDMPTSNVAVEWFNNKTKVISHRTYGISSAKNYILNLYHCMG